MFRLLIMCFLLVGCGTEKIYGTCQKTKKEALHVAANEAGRKLGKFKILQEDYARCVYNKKGLVGHAAMLRVTRVHTQGGCFCGGGK